MIFLLLLALATTHAQQQQAIDCKLSRVHLQTGDDMEFLLTMSLLPPSPSSSSTTSPLLGAINPSSTSPSTSAPATQLNNATCHWIVVARPDESTTFESIHLPTSAQIIAGHDAMSTPADISGSFTSQDSSDSSMSMIKAASTDFGQVAFVVTTTVVSGKQVAAKPMRISMPRRCRYSRSAVVTPARWSYKTNLTSNLADHGATSIPQSTPSNLLDDEDASLASQIYISGGTYDSSTSSRNPMSGRFEASSYWVDAIHTGKSYRYYPSDYTTLSSVVTQTFPSSLGVGLNNLISATGGSSDTDKYAPTLARVQRRLFGMVGVMPDQETLPLLFHLGGINEIDGILKRTDVLRLSKKNGKEGYWDVTSKKEWDLIVPRHSVAATSWLHPKTGHTHLFVIGGNTEDGATRNDVEMLVLPSPKVLGDNKYLETISPELSFHSLNGTLLVARSRASAVVVDNMLYVIGGELALLGEVEKCNLLNGCQKFVQIAPLRKPRYAGAAIWSTEMEEILYIGGFRVGQYCDYEKQCNDDAPTFVNLVAGPSTDVESFHIETDSWNPRANLQVARYGLAVAEISLPNLGFDDPKGDDDENSNFPMRTQIVAIGGIGGLVWEKAAPMSPRRVSTVEVFSCYQYSKGGRHRVVSLVVVIVAMVVGLVSSK